MGVWEADELFPASLDESAVGVQSDGASPFPITVTLGRQPK